MLEWLKKLFAPRYKSRWVVMWSDDERGLTRFNEFYLREQAEFFVTNENPRFWSLGQLDKDGYNIVYDSSYHQKLQRGLK